MRCKAHGFTNCRECNRMEEMLHAAPTFEPCTEDRVIARVIVSVDKAEVDKLNRRAAEQGRAMRSAGDIVEAAIADALKGIWSAQDVRVTIETHP